MNIVIRPETPRDYYASELVAKRAFWNLHAPGCDEHYLVHKLRGDAAFIPELSRVAEVDGTVVGLIMYARASLVTANGPVEVINFGPLCVDPVYQRKGVGGALLRETLPLAREMGFRGVLIFGEPDYYPLFGFKTCDFWGITTANGDNFPAFMGFELQPGGLDLPGARFVEASVYEDLPADEVEAFDRHFPVMPKLKLPGQW